MKKLLPLQRKLTKALLVTLVFAPLSAALAHASTLTITYYTVAETDKDTNTLAGGVFNNEVQNSLGVHDLPVLNTPAYGCTSNCYSPTGAPTDVLSDGEITYWSPSLNNGGAGGTSDVTKTGSGNVTLPFDVSQNFFPPNGGGSSDYNGFQAATLSGTLFAPTAENINFTIGSDDMAFVYLDGSVVCDDGGIHGFSPVGCTSAVIGVGNHSLEVFFVDLDNSQSGLSFSVDTTGIVTVGNTPEPGTLTLLGSGLVGLAGIVRRKIALRRS